MTDTVNVPQEMIEAVMKVAVGVDECGSEVFPGPLVAAELVRAMLAAAPKAEQEPVICHHEAYQGYCAHCGVKIVNGFAVRPKAHPAPASDELLEALEPFAKGGGHRTMPGLPPDYTVADFGDGIVITVADFRRAAELYDKHKGPQS